MTYKSEGLREEFSTVPALLQFIVTEFVTMSNDNGIIPVMTRVREKITGSSGVHEAGRGVDFRDEHEGELTYSESLRKRIVSELNTKYERTDGKKTVVWHSFQGAPHHFHIQVALDPKTYTKAQLVQESSVAENPQAA